MKKLKSALKVIEFSSLSLSIAFHKTIIKWLETNWLIKEEALLLILAVVIVIFVFVIIDYILDKLVELAFIRKLILGEDYIEGHWIELAYDVQNGQAISYSLISIKGNGDSLILSGDSYDYATSTPIGSFTSNSITYEYPHLYYNYKYDITNEINLKEGISRIKFNSHFGKSPLSLTGFFIDIDSNTKVNFIAWKVYDYKLIKRLSNPELFHTEVLNYVQRMKSSSTH